MISDDKKVYNEEFKSLEEALLVMEGEIYNNLKPKEIVISIEPGDNQQIQSFWNLETSCSVTISSKRDGLYSLSFVGGNSSLSLKSEFKVYNAVIIIHNNNESRKIFQFNESSKIYFQVNN